VICALSRDTILRVIHETPEIGFQITKLIGLRLRTFRSRIEELLSRPPLAKTFQEKGVMGLARSFFVAGATRVVASLYKVKDEPTAELMEAFYQAMLGPERPSPAAARPMAQMKMHAQPRWRDPYWWSAFVLMGEPQ
jgi:hypothetical protein